MAPMNPDGADGGITQQGYLGLVKRKGLEKRYFLLRGDMLEYYKNEDEALDDSKPASKVFSVSTITVTPQDDGSITLHIGDQTATLREIDAGDAKVWTDALMIATGQVKDEEEADVGAEAEEAQEEEEAEEEEDDEAAAQEPKEKPGDEEQPGAAQRGAESEEEYEEEEEEIEEEDPAAERSRGGEDSEGAAENPEDAPEPPEPEHPEDVLCEGQLEIMKKGQKKMKYFVLFKDRLDYWATAEDRASGGGATGSLPAEVVEELDVMDWGFSLRVQGDPPPKPLELHSTDPESHRMWLDKMQRWKWGKQEPARAPGAQRDLVKSQSFAEALSRRRQERPQPATNFSFVEAPSRQEPAAEVAAAPAPASGSVVHEAPLEMVKGKSAPLRYGVLTGEEFSYYTSRDEYLQGANPRGRAPLSDVTSLRCSKSSGLMTMTVKDTEKVITLRPPGGKPELEVWAGKWTEALARGAAGLAVVEQSDDERDDGHDDPRLKEGTFLVNRGGQVQARHFALYADRMESWTDKASCDKRDAPQREFSISEVDDIEVLDNGLEVGLRDAPAPITLLGPTGHELDSWAEAISRILEGAVPSAKPRCIHKGLLEVGQPGATRMESTYVVIFSDRYEEHRSFLDFNAGRAGPLLSVDLLDVAELKVTGTTFELRLRSGEVRRLTEPRKQDLQSWLKAWGEALSGPAFDCKAGGRRWIRNQAADGANARAARGLEPAEQTEPHDAAPPSVSSTSRAVETKFIKEGLLGFAKGSGLAWKYCILEQDRLSAWSDMGAAATRKSPDVVLDISSSGGFQAVGAGFVLACGERKIGVHVGADGDIHGWSQAFSQAFNAHMFDAASPDVASAWTPPSQFGSHLGLPASPVGLASSGRSGRSGTPGSSRATGPQRSRSVEPGGRGSPGWLPRCAMMSRTKRPTVGAAELWQEVVRKAPKLRSHAPLDSSEEKANMHFSSHANGAEAAATLHGPHAKFHIGSAPSSGPMRRGGPAGAEVGGKSPVQTRDSSAPLLGKPVQVHPGKVTDSGFNTARCLPTRAEVGSAPGWSKISGHHENRAITITSVAVQEQPCTPKVTTSRRAGSSPPPSVRDRAIASRAVLGKITDAGSPAPPSGRDTRAVLGKITDAGRSDLRDQLAARKQAAAAREPSHKASDPSRITARGDASTARVASVDRHTPMSHKSAKSANAHNARGALNVSF